MDEGYELAYTEKPEWATIGQGINEYNEQQAGKENGKSLCFVLKGPKGDILGGVIGSTYWDWFHLDLMWLKDGLRGRGYGHQLLVAAEDEARKRGAKNVFLDTFSFQAPGFYEKHGYRVFGELQDFPAGHRRFFLTKEL